MYPHDIGRKLNVHKTFRSRPERVRSILVVETAATSRNKKPKTAAAVFRGICIIFRESVSSALNNMPL